MQCFSTRSKRQTFSAKLQREKNYGEFDTFILTNVCPFGIVQNISKTSDYTDHGDELRPPILYMLLLIIVHNGTLIATDLTSLLGYIMNICATVLSAVLIE